MRATIRGFERNLMAASFSSGEPPSRALFESASRGDRSCLEDLLQRHMGGLRAWLRLRASDRLLAHDSPSDLVQSVCLEVLQSLDSFRFTTEGAFRHWLYLTAEHKLIDRARYWTRAKRDMHRERPGPYSGSGELGEIALSYSSLSPSRVAAAREELERVEEAFTQLSADHRQVLLLHRIAGLTHAEIAFEMNRSEVAARGLLFRALARLSTLLGPEAGS